MEILEEEAQRGWRDREVTALLVRLNKRVHTKIAEYRPAAPTAGEVPSTSRSLANLQAFLEP